MIELGTKGKTGDSCEASGRYRFDGYTDGTIEPAPSREEMEIPLSEGETFPPIRSAGKACHWKLMERI